MKPILLVFTLPLLGQVTFPAYFTLLTLGFALATWLTVRRAPRLGLDRELILDLNLYIVIWGIIGSRILHLFADGQGMDYVNLCLDPHKVKAVDALVGQCLTDKACGYDYLCDPLRHVCYPPRDCLAWAKLWRGGLAYYGGFLLATPLALRFIRNHKMNMWTVSDLAAPAILLGLVFGRLGCFLNGCCYGKTTHSALGVVFPRGSAPWQAQYEAHLIQPYQQMLPVHPTQLYESLGCLVLFLFTYFGVTRWKKREGQVLGAMLIGYAVLRSLVEIVRDDDRGVFFGWLSTSQIISVPLFAWGLYLLLRKDAPISSTPAGAATPAP